MSFIPSPMQQNFFNWVDTGTGNGIVEAVAGSGKTTTIIKALPLMVGSVFLGAYNSKMAEELRERTVSMQNVVASTFHSAGYRALKYAFKNHALLIDKFKVPNLVSATIEKRPDLELYGEGVIKLVSMAKQYGMDPDMAEAQDWADLVYHYGIEDSLPETFSMEKLTAFARVTLVKSNKILEVIDYDDMVYLPLQLDVRMFENDWVLIDEAQDVNPVRLALAQKMLKPTGRLIAVGDSRQAIFGFTGSMSDSLDQIKSTFNAVSMPLSVSYRCPKVIVKHAQQWNPVIEAHESAIGGCIAEIDYEMFLTAVLPGDAVLCRNNSYLVKAFLQMVRRGIPAKIEGKQIAEGLKAIINRWKSKSLISLGEKLPGYLKCEVEKALKAKNETRADLLTDQVETIYVLLDRARELNIETRQALCVMIDEMFGDDIRGDRVTLCSAHRSKGLEWDRVFLLGRKELMPSKFAKRPWQLQQEANLIYVAVTRAKKTLIEVNGVTTEKPKKET